MTKSEIYSTMSMALQNTAAALAILQVYGQAANTKLCEVPSLFYTLTISGLSLLAYLEVDIFLR